MPPGPREATRPLPVPYPGTVPQPEVPTTNPTNVPGGEGGEPGPQQDRGPLPALVHRAARWLTAPVLLAVVVAVTWPSGAQVAEFKDQAGPGFLDLVGKDVVLNLAMLAPLTFMATLGWPRVRPWVWGLAGTALSALAETTQWALPVLQRRATVDNVLQNSVGAWLGVGVALLVRAWAARGHPTDPHP